LQDMVSAVSLAKKMVIMLLQTEEKYLRR